MSLNFDFSKIKNYEIVTTHPDDLGKDPSKEDVRYHPVFETLVWSTMIIGVSSITENNLKMVQDRVAQYQKASGALMGNSYGPIYITDEDVAKYVGLSTNVEKLSDKQWHEKLCRLILREATFRTSTSHRPVVSAYDMSYYMSIKKEDGSNYVQ